MRTRQNDKKRVTPSYYIAYERDGKNGYIASAPAIPGCAVHGKTLQEAYHNIQIAIQECLEVISDFKKKPPQETIHRAVIEKRSFVTPKVKVYA